MSDYTAVPLSSKARISLAIARGLAAARGDDNITPSHVALGLLREGENAAVATLVDAGVDLHALRKALEHTLGPEGRPRPGEVSIALTAGEELVRTRAAAESLRQRDPFLGPQHLLLALLQDTSTHVTRELARHGVTYEVTVRRLSHVLAGRQGDGAPPSAPPAA